MSDDKFVQNLKQTLDSDQPGSDIERKLQQRRVQVLEQAESVAEKGLFSWRKQLVPAFSLALALVAVLVFFPLQQEVFTEISALDADELEIISNLDIEQLDELEFYDWLDSQEGHAG